MRFEDTLVKAKMSDKKAMLEIIEMYRPLMIKYAVVNGCFDEDLYQEFIYTLLYALRSLRLMTVQNTIYCAKIFDKHKICVYDKCDTSFFGIMAENKFCSGKRSELIF